METVKIDTKKAEEFGERMLETLNGGAVAIMTSIGHRTGLFDTMATLPASTQPAEPTQTSSPTVTPMPPTPTQTPEPGATQMLASYWPFGLMVLGLILIGLFVRGRRGR